MTDAGKRRAVEDRAATLRGLLSGRGDVAEKRMFGGLTFMVAGHMCCGAAPDCFVFRIGPDRYPQALQMPQARPCDFTGRPMTGMVMVADDPAAPPDALKTWVAWSLEFVSTLPARR